RGKLQRHGGLTRRGSRLSGGILISNIKSRPTVVSVTARHLTLVGSNTARRRTGLCITFAMRIYPYEIIKRPSVLRARPRDCGWAVLPADRARPRRAAAVHTGGKCGGGFAGPDRSRVQRNIDSAGVASQVAHEARE